jgi:rhamnose utilization protein RhaD (predicted bifunctional aldolase and dehydrogenase)
MYNKSNKIENYVNNYCSKIGLDPLLVQGAGGNISWKEGNILWIKASGMWLAEASEKNIFVPVNLAHLQDSMNNGDFSILPKVINDSALKPSIETLLHALMPHPIVIHLHAIEILARLVQKDCEHKLAEILGDSINYAVVNYYKPGAELAHEVHKIIKKNKKIDFIFLKNHGVVVSGNTVDEVEKKLSKLINLLKLPIDELSSILLDPVSQDNKYFPIDDSDIHQLAIHPVLLERVINSWALYPDHVVFLGEKAHVYQSWSEFSFDKHNMDKSPDLIFIKNHGVFINHHFNKAKHEQLRCYYNVVIRLKTTSNTYILEKSEIESLLNWNCEQYRLLCKTSG